MLVRVSGLGWACLIGTSAVDRTSVYPQTTISIASNRTTHHPRYTGILHPRADMLVLGGEPTVTVDLVDLV